MTDESVFAAARAIRDPADRAAFLDRACPDPAVRREVEALLAAHDASSPLDRPPADLARTGAFVPSEPAGRPGSVIANRFKLLECIGEGGMGEVWVADQLEPIKRRVALKVIKAGMDSRSVLARFEAERQALALMDHPNIAKVLDAGTTPEGRPYFAMELVKGTPITEFCDARKLSPRERLELFVPVCQAIQHAHTKGIIHRDIKPTNVLVALHDEKPVPKVIDFGVAKAVGQQLTEKTIYTGFGALVGTPAYMAPEQATFNQLDIDTRADVYALGVLLYELLAGSPPVEPERLKKAALDEVLRLVREEEPPRPSQRLSTSQARASIAAVRQTDPAKLSKLMRGELDWIVMKALEKDRNRRYETATGLAADVQRHLAGEPVLAHPPSTAYRLRKFARKNRAGLITSTAFAGLLLAAAAVSVWLAIQARRAEAVAEDRRQDAEETARQLALARDAAVAARDEEKQQRLRVEDLAAKEIIMSDLAVENPRLRLVRLCRTLTQVPMGQPLREFLSLNILACGQAMCPLRPPLRHGGSECRIESTSKDGTAVATLADDGSAVVWETTTWQPKFVLRSAGGTIDSVQFDLNDTLLITADHRAHRIEIWDANTGRARVAISTGGRGHARLHWTIDPTGRFLCTAYSSGRVPPDLHDSTQLWDLRTGQRIGAIPLTDMSFTTLGSFVFSADGSRLITRLADRFCIWSARDGQLMVTAPCPSSLFGTFAVSPNGLELACKVDGGIRTYDVTTGNLKQTYQFINAVNDVDFSIRYLTDRVLTTDRVAIVDGRAYGFSVLDVDHELAALRDGGMFDLRSGSFLPITPTRTYHPQFARFSRDGRFAALSSGDIIDLAVDNRIDVDPLLLPLVRQLPDPAILAVWGKVVACGDVDARSEFHYWDEATWASNRQELIRLAKPMGSVPFPGQVVDPLFWAKSTVRPEHLSDAQDLKLLDRIIDAEPNVEYLRQRAELQFKLGNVEQAAADESRAYERAASKYWIRHVEGTPPWFVKVVQSAGRPKEQYEWAIPQLERARSVGRQWYVMGGETVSASLLMGYYRAGRYSDAVTVSPEIDDESWPALVGGLMTAWWLPVMSLTGDLKLVEPDPLCEAYRAMAFHKLGDASRARTALALARRVEKRFRSEILFAAIAEAEALIEGPKR